VTTAKTIVIGLAVSLAVGSLLSLFASPNPDGLERVAMDAGFEHAAGGEPLVRSPFPDYLFAGIENERLATGLAGFTGTLALFAVGTGLGAILKRGAKKRRGGEKDGTLLSR
jgi:hypothetical protein